MNPKITKRNSLLLNKELFLFERLNFKRINSQNFMKKHIKKFNLKD